MNQHQLYEPNTPLMNEKLPGIDKLPKPEESLLDHKQGMYAYLPPPPPNYTGMVYPHISPPLTPAVSPSSILLDSMQYNKRKFSVDVGPFGFGHLQDPLRRSSCTSMDYSLVQKPSRRGSRANLTGPATQHKHACKYPYCTWSFKRYEHLKRHMLVHTGKRPHVCQYPGCGKSFSRSDNFHAHYRTHTKKEQGKKFKAQQQQQVFEDRTFYEKPTSFDMYQDMYTRSQFTQEDNQVTPYTIQEDSSPFMSENVLNHEVYSQYYGYYPPMPEPQQQDQSIAAAAAVVAAAVDTSKKRNQKNHTCPVLQCQRGFKRLEHLKRHMRIHTLERPFNCTFPNCHKAFSRSDNLSQHMKTHQRVEDRRRKQKKKPMMSNMDMPWTPVNC